jgi:polyhydroxyalkanoate synthesis regulator phasin
MPISDAEIASGQASGLRSDMRRLLKRIEELEKRVEELEKNAPEPEPEPRVPYSRIEG